MFEWYFDVCWLDGVEQCCYLFLSVVDQFFMFEYSYDLFEFVWRSEQVFILVSE